MTQFDCDATCDLDYQKLVESEYLADFSWEILSNKNKKNPLSNDKGFGSGLTGTSVEPLMLFLTFLNKL